MRLLVCLMGMGLLVMSGVAQAAKCTNDAAVLAARQAADAACGTCANADNHGDYVSCVADFAKNDAQLPEECRGAVTSCAARSTCGKEGFVTCCRVSSRGKSKCSIKKEGKCKAPKGGSATPGTGSCCDACQGATTTSTVVTTSSTSAPVTTTTQQGSPSGAFAND